MLLYMNLQEGTEVTLHPLALIVLLVHTMVMLQMILGGGVRLLQRTYAFMYIEIA